MLYLKGRKVEVSTVINTTQVPLLEGMLSAEAVTSVWLGEKLMDGSHTLQRSLFVLSLVCCP